MERMLAGVANPLVFAKHSGAAPHTDWAALVVRIGPQRWVSRRLIG